MPLPPRLQEVVDDFSVAPLPLRIELLVEYAARVVTPPAEVVDEPGRLERVEECRTPVWLATGIADDGTVQVWFDATPEATTTLGYAGVLTVGLTGARVEEVLAVENGFHHALGLTEVITPLRLRGMDAILSRIKRRLVAVERDARP